MNHYQEANGFKVHDEVYRLNHYDIEKATILDIFDDYYDDESDYICKWVRTDMGFDHLEDIFESECFAERAVQNKKNSYDRYVTSRY